jgi:hypothetical protein
MNWWRFGAASTAVCSLGVAVLTGAQRPLPQGAVALVNEARSGRQIAICAQTGEPEVRQGARRIVPTAVWVGIATDLHKLRAGLGACDPAWSPNGRFVAVTAVDGLWVFPAASIDGTLRVESRVPMGEPNEFTYRAFSHPQWSPDGLLVAVVVTNGGTSWVEVFDVATGGLLYTSPPEQDSFIWSNRRELKLGDIEVQLPGRR